jgi:hypothetical protein
MIDSIRVQIPARYTAEVSALAVMYAQSRAPRNTGAGAKALRPVQEDGQIGITVAPGYEYMLVQNNGMAARNMYELEGKVIPMRGRDGKIHFRTVKGVGRRKITQRNAKGQIVSSKIAWRHPGLQPKNFMQYGIYAAVNQWVADLSPQKLNEILMSTDLVSIMKSLSGEK